MAEANKKDRGKWFREMRSELKKVVWPDGKTTAKNTGTVILCSLGVGVFIWVFDAVAVLAVQALDQPLRRLRSRAWLITQSGMFFTPTPAMKTP